MWIVGAETPIRISQPRGHHLGAATDRELSPGFWIPGAGDAARGKCFSTSRGRDFFLKNKMRTTQTKKTTPTKKTKSKARKATTKSEDPHGWEALFKSIKEPLNAEKILITELYPHSWKSFVTDEDNRILWDTWRRVTDLNPEITTWEMTRIMLMRAAAEIRAALPSSNYKD
jgi:hypothetical protein